MEVRREVVFEAEEVQEQPDAQPLCNTQQVVTTHRDTPVAELITEELHVNVLDELKVLGYREGWCSRLVCELAALAPETSCLELYRDWNTDLACREVGLL